jgi:hypothetical protein
LPFWLFLIVALYLYFVPITGAHKVSAPFFVLLLISLFESQGILDAIIFAAIFYFILLIKDLLIIDRRSAYESSYFRICSCGVFFLRLVVRSVGERSSIA